MNSQLPPSQTQPPASLNSDRQSAANTHLHGRWLVLARVLWMAIFLLTLVVFCANLIVGSYGLVSTILLAAVTSVWFAAGLVLSWRKSTDWTILLISLGLVVVGGVIIPPYPGVLFQWNYWVWAFPLNFLEFLAQTALIIVFIFPDGRFVPGFTRWLALGWAAVSLVTNLPAILPGALYPWSWWSSPLFTLVRIALYGSLALAFLYRYRRVSTPLQRQQIKWVVFASSIVLLEASVANLVLSVVPSYFPALVLSPQLNQLVLLLTYSLPVLIPLSIGIALLRYRLWDIDRVINRTLAYGTLSATLALIYVGSILLLQFLLRELTGQFAQNQIAIVGSTLVIAALFQPLRRGIQSRIDRRFYRRKYDAVRTIAAFSATLRGEIDLHTLSEQLVRVVQETMQPVSVSLWLQRHERQGPQQDAGSGAAEKAPSRQPISSLRETDRAERAEEMSTPASHRISRRAVLLGLAAGGVVGAGGVLAQWLLRRRPIFTYFGHTDWVYGVVWSPDGTRIASCSKDKTVQVWDVIDGRHVFTYRGHTAAVYKVAWSPDGKRLASCSKDKTVQVWDATDGRHVFTYRGHKDEVGMVVWSPDGTRLASGGGVYTSPENGKPSDHTVQVWDAADGGHVLTYDGHTDAVAAVGWSTDGRRIASGSWDHTVQVWDATNGGHVFTYRGHTDRVNSIAWSPDGLHLASGSLDKTVQVWDAVRGKPSFTFTGHTDEVLYVAWSPDSTRIASGSSDWTVQVWDATNGGHVFVYTGHTNVVDAIAWSPAGTRIASSGYDDTVLIWSPD